MLLLGQEVAQCVRELMGKPSSPSSFLGTYVLEGGTDSLKLFSHLHRTPCPPSRINK